MSDIEITEEMIEAGCEAIWSAIADLSFSSSYEELARQVYASMVSFRPKRTKFTPDCDGSITVSLDDEPARNMP